MLWAASLAVFCAEPSDPAEESIKVEVLVSRGSVKVLRRAPARLVPASSAQSGLQWRLLDLGEVLAEGKINDPRIQFLDGPDAQSSARVEAQSGLVILELPGRSGELVFSEPGGPEIGRVRFDPDALPRRPQPGKAGAK